MADPHLIVCGGLRPAAIPPAWRRSARTHLDMGQGDDVHLRLDQLTSKMRAGVPDAAVDLLEVAAFVYAADQAITRGGTNSVDYGDAWRRHLRFVIPVRCPDLYNRADVREAFAAALGFLTDDAYEFHFTRAANPVRADAYLGDHVAPDGTEFAEVILFSGGADSLCGAVEEVLAGGRRVVLLSHQSATRITARQRVVFEALRDRVRRSRSAPLHVGVTLNKGEEHNRDFTQRSRSFVFATLAAVVARQVGLRRVRFYENGITSLNLPVSPELVGARASRTTHPQSLARFGRLFSLIFDIPFAVENPFQEFTKAQILARLQERGHADLCALTCSCVHVWGQEESRPHCGRCSQCVDRRLSVLAARLSDAADPPARYESDPLTGERDGPDLTFAERYVGMAREVTRIESPRAFAVRFPEVNDALPYFGNTTAEAARAVHGLYRRHGDGVLRALQGVLAARPEDLVWQVVPPRSLLGVTLGRAAPPPVVSVPSGERGFVVDRGRFEVRWNGRPCPLGNTLEFRFIERLHLAGDTYLPVETIAEEVWGNPRTQANSVQRVVGSLRRLFREAGFDGVVIDGEQAGHYRLVLPGRDSAGAA